MKAAESGFFISLSGTLSTKVATNIISFGKQEIMAKNVSLLNLWSKNCIICTKIQFGQLL